MIIAKKGVDLRELTKVDRKLRMMVDVYAFLAKTLYGDDIVITSIWRDQAGSTHKYWRAVDIAILQSGMENSKHLRHVMNLLFPYGDSIHQTVPALDHGTAPHTHLQVMAKHREVTREV